MDNRNRFDGKGEIYAKARPKYAKALFEYLKNVLNVPFDSVFADIGSGTGIFTEQLLDCWRKVYAVEPNADMRRKAEERISRIESFISVDGSDADTKLPDGSVDFVTAAQTFHWFDAEAFGKECRRILRPGGKVMIIYNFRNPNAACTKALAELRHRYSPEFQGFSNGINDENAKPSLSENARFSVPTTLSTTISRATSTACCRPPIRRTRATEDIPNI